MHRLHHHDCAFQSAFRVVCGALASMLLRRRTAQTAAGGWQRAEGLSDACAPAPAAVACLGVAGDVVAVSHHGCAVLHKQNPRSATQSKSSKSMHIACIADSEPAQKQAAAEIRSATAQVQVKVHLVAVPLPEGGGGIDHVQGACAHMLLGWALTSAHIPLTCCASKTGKKRCAPWPKLSSR